MLSKWVEKRWKRTRAVLYDHAAVDYEKCYVKMSVSHTSAYTATTTWLGRLHGQSSRQVHASHQLVLIS